MSSNATTSVAVAKSILMDIQDKGLLPGDRYLTAQDAGLLFQVRKSVANEAMRHLAERALLVRRRKAGTFVGPSYHPEGTEELVTNRSGEKTLERIHVFMTRDYVRTRFVPGEVFAEVLGDAFRGCSVQIHHIPELDAADYVCRSIAEIREQRNFRSGLVLIRSPREGQIVAAESGLPTVVFGSIYPGVNLPFVDIDQAAVGKIAGEYIAQRCDAGCVLFMRHEWRRGDNLMLNDMTSALARAGRGLDDVEIHSILADAEAIRAETRDYLEHNSTPSLIACRDDFYARAVQQVLEEMTFGAGARPEILSLQAIGNHACDFARVASVEPVEAQVQAIARLLLSATSNKNPEDTNMELSPICIQMPKEAA